MKNTNKNARIILAYNIKKYRDAQKLTQESLADFSGLHRTYISSVERCERNISIDAIEKIATAFGISVNKLLEK